MGGGSHSNITCLNPNTKREETKKRIRSRESKNAVLSTAHLAQHFQLWLGEAGDYWLTMNKENYMDASLTSTSLQSGSWKRANKLTGANDSGSNPAFNCIVSPSLETLKSHLYMVLGSLL